MSMERALPLDELWSGEMRQVIVRGVRVLLVNVDGSVRAYEDRCRHQGVALSLGKLEGDVLTCSAHAWQYDVRTGCGVNPESVRLRAFAVAVALCESGRFAWSEFQQSLIAEIGAAEAAGHATVGGPDYYRHWLSALTRLLETKGIVDAAELAGRIAEAGPPPPPQDPRGRHI